MWRITISNISGVTGNVTATFTDEVTGYMFSYSSIIKQSEAAAFVTKAKEALAKDKARLVIVNGLIAQLETALNN